jgi:hypothetical protein
MTTKNQNRAVNSAGAHQRFKTSMHIQQQQNKTEIESKGTFYDFVSQLVVVGGKL